MERIDYNRKILKKLEELVEESPDARFWQLLYNANVIRGTRNGKGELQITDDYAKESEWSLKQLNYYIDAETN